MSNTDFPSGSGFIQGRVPGMDNTGALQPIINCVNKGKGATLLKLNTDKDRLVKVSGGAEKSEDQRKLQGQDAKQFFVKKIGDVYGPCLSKLASEKLKVEEGFKAASAMDFITAGDCLINARSKVPEEGIDPSIFSRQIRLTANTQPGDGKLADLGADLAVSIWIEKLELRNLHGGGDRFDELYGNIFLTLDDDLHDYCETNLGRMQRSLSLIPFDSKTLTTSILKNPSLADNASFRQGLKNIARQSDGEAQTDLQKVYSLLRDTLREELDDIIGFMDGPLREAKISPASRQSVFEASVYSGLSVKTCEALLEAKVNEDFAAFVDTNTLELCKTLFLSGGSLLDTPGGFDVLETVAADLTKFLNLDTSAGYDADDKFTAIAEGFRVHTVACYEEGIASTGNDPSEVLREAARDHAADRLAKACKNLELCAQGLNNRQHHETVRDFASRIPTRSEAWPVFDGTS